MVDMYRTAAVVVGAPKQLLPAVCAAASLVKEVMYVPLAPKVDQSSSNGDVAAMLKTPPLGEISHWVDQLFLQVSKLNPNLDLRVLLPRSSLSPQPPLQHKVDVLLSTASSYQDAITLPSYQLLPKQIGLEIQFKELELSNQPQSVDMPLRDAIPCELTPSSDVALGGTFDCIHNGHRLLLSQAAILATNRVLVGVADGVLLKNKTLSELIKPVEERVAEVEALLGDIQPGLSKDVVPITDVYGPTAWDEKLECLVVSAETKGGGDMVNEERKRRGLQPLSVHSVFLLGEGTNESTTVAAKTSSSDLRKQLLGSLRKPKINHCLTSWESSEGPYILGLTGGTASGKSSIARRLEDLGAYCIDCDKLGHEVYRVGTVGYSQVVEEFGEGILKDDGEVDRAALGPIVFSDTAKLQRLNEIVWPQILKLADEKISQAHNRGFRVCVLDAAVLLKADWDRRCHEVWASIIPPQEAIHRVMERDGKTEEAAKRRLSAQLSNQEVIDHAHVVFSTLWEREFTQKQVVKAWSKLQERIRGMSKECVTGW